MYDTFDPGVVCALWINRFDLAEQICGDNISANAYTLGSSGKRRRFGLAGGNNRHPLCNTADG